MKVSILPVAVIAASTLFSCVSQKKYDELQNKFNSAYSENQGCQTELAVAKAKLANFESNQGQYENTVQSERNQIKQLQEQLKNCINGGSKNVSELVNEINQSNKYIKHLIDAKSKSDSLNMVLTNNLTRSLSSNEAKDVDVKVLKGVVYISLADNMLYKSGSYEISPAAGETLSKIAKIINDYRDYDVLIEGNTDNVPISKPNIRNNWDLSALRASSVVQALQNQYGVDGKRLTAGGRGEFNPLTTNATAEGKSKNRRTQIIILPKLDQFMDLIGQAPKN
ncbi:OmpA family protein [Empedobacter falsenii]|uniref:OmpA/MotB family protein n=1 Tax=Empedobacter TaxID=59734 RepID=UPI00244C7C71|nr:MULTISPECIES: OmpA family protein [Empedobacter]MDH1883783.1 OmpA family protein [Empedobacter sp. GD03797]MDM1042510.1 OmpA family protein [Empedobacter brevis]MDM1136440.1 OmpA family protein [Empedobacter sp. R750]MDM1299603.1 OmpA family protein [Empedobacter falsenii]MDM1319396.1 OmpA family protein [Empedobacter falsenii]